MQQTKARSLLEAKANIVFGFVLSGLFNWLWCEWHNVPFAWKFALELTLILTVTSFIRQYVIRRLFNWWDHGEARRGPARGETSKSPPPTSQEDGGPDR